MSAARIHWHREMEMKFPVGPEEVKIVEGNSGKGLQVVCSCGCVNWNHVEITEATWPCRNCGRVLSHDFPGLVARVKALPKTVVRSQESGVRK
jgi:hypothetical protein